MKRSILTLLVLSGLTATASIAAPPAGRHAIYQADLRPLNGKITNTAATGTATLAVKGKFLEVTIRMRGLPPGIEHWEHFHGFPNATQATCATVASDRNADGYVDLAETEAVSGTTMVPFNAEPAKMDIPTHTYPKADASGAFTYSKKIPLAELGGNFAAKFDGGQIDLAKRVIYVHGIPADHSLPASVKSLDPIPAHVTLPLACGAIRKIQ